jgi:hypothetical protein
MRFASMLVPAALLLTVSPARGVGQSWDHLSGASVERYFQGDQSFIAVSYRRTELERGGVGLDFGLGLVPQELRSNVVLMGLDVGLAGARRLGPATVMLKGGVSSFVTFWAENELYPGLQAGIAAVVPLERRCGLRLDLARHVYFPARGTFQLWSIGIGLTVHPVAHGTAGRSGD